MTVDRTPANDQILRYLTVGVPACEQGDDLSLPLAERICRRHVGLRRRGVSLARILNQLIDGHYRPLGPRGGEPVGAHRYASGGQLALVRRPHDRRHRHTRILAKRGGG